jgi:AraC-like DNA-binding protein
MQLLVNLAGDRLRWYEGKAAPTPHSTARTAFHGCYVSSFAIDVAEQRAIAGVVFKPGGSAPFLSVPAHELLGSHVALAELWRDGDDLPDQLRKLQSSPEALLARLEVVLASRLDPSAVADAGMTWAVDSLARGARVGAVVERLGTSPHTFIARFERTVGLKPKLFERIARFQRALRVGRNGDWARAAAQAGYADQAHLTREVRTFAGTTPAAWVAPDAPDSTPG